MRIFLIRHGQSVNNATPRDQWVVDPPLTALGQQQAQALADYWPQHREIDSPEPIVFNRILVSPMRRTLQTAAPLVAQTGVAPEIWPDIHEFGGNHHHKDDPEMLKALPGLGREAILALLPTADLSDPRLGEQGWYPHPGEESRADGWARTIRVAIYLQERAATPAGKDETLALVVHGGFLDGLMKALMNLGPLPFERLFTAHYNTAFTRVDLTTRTFFHYINRTSHLRPEQVSW